MTDFIRIVFVNRELMRRLLCGRLDYYKKVKCAFLFWMICCNYFSWLIVTDKNKIDKIKYITYPNKKYNILK